VCPVLSNDRNRRNLVVRARPSEGWVSSRPRQTKSLCSFNELEKRHRTDWYNPLVHFGRSGASPNPLADLGVRAGLNPGC
jgi:hypothetical protein